MTALAAVPPTTIHNSRKQWLSMRRCMSYAPCGLVSRPLTRLDSYVLDYACKPE